MALVLCSSMTAYAKPTKMPDGAMFDPEYYAENNPDVVATLGSTTEALYKHYTQYGKVEGRKAYSGDKPSPATPGSVERSALAKSTKTTDNDQVAAGQKLVLPDGAITKSGTTADGIHWESSWFLQYNSAWERIYDAYSGIAFVVEDITKGEVLSECMNGNIDTGGVEMYLDFGLFVDYLDQLKAKGVVPQSYQLPKTYYTITKTGGTYKSGIYTQPYVTTDCPEALAIYNSRVNGASYKDVPRSYTPKYQREQAAK